jgi:ZIP family zinc transporter
VAAVCTLLLAGSVVPLIPYFLSFAAGAMFYVVAEELLKENSHIGTAFFALGISLMTVISCAL